MPRRHFTLGCAADTHFRMTHRTAHGRLLAAIAFIGLALFQPALATAQSDADDDARYRACMARIETDPQGAFDMALNWTGLGGGIGARHCSAAALLALGLPKDAAVRLESIAHDHQGPARQRARLLADAAQAWLNADELERAEGVLDSALLLEDQNPDIWISRAVVRASRDNLSGAQTDLDSAILLDPFDGEALALRANARRRLGQSDGALQDAERALMIDPRFPEALLERGLLRATAGDLAAARKDWLSILNVAPDSAAADAARENLEQMDVRKP